MLTCRTHRAWFPLHHLVQCKFELSMSIFEKNPKNLQKPVKITQLDGTNWYIFLNCLVGHFHFIILKGHHHERSIKPSASTGQIGLMWSYVSAYSCSMVPHVWHSATSCWAPLLYIIICWLSPIDRDDVGPCRSCTVMLWEYSCTVMTWDCTVAVQ